MIARAKAGENDSPLKTKREGLLSQWMKRKHRLDIFLTENDNNVDNNDSTIIESSINEESWPGMSLLAEAVENSTFTGISDVNISTRNVCVSECLICLGTCTCTSTFDV